LEAALKNLKQLTDHERQEIELDFPVGCAIDDDDVRDWFEAHPPPKPKRIALRKPKRKLKNNTFFQLGQFLRKAIDAATAPLEARIAELEQRPIGLDYKGVYVKGRSYSKNMGVSHAGSIWVAVREYPEKEPGQPHSGWRLAVKRGTDGKDAR
jgi:hypothetical protein